MSVRRVLTREQAECAALDKEAAIRARQRLSQCPTVVAAAVTLCTGNSRWRAGHQVKLTMD